MLATFPTLTGGEVAALVVFGVVSVGLGIVLLADGLRRVRFRRRASEEFERVDAVVVDSAVHTPATGGPEGVPHVEYEFTVDGATYTSRSLWPTPSRSPESVDLSVARRVVADHPQDAEVIARYDPEDPETSYLIEEFDRTGERIELALGSLLLAGFVALVVVVVGVL